MSAIKNTTINVVRREIHKSFNRSSAKMRRDYERKIISIVHTVR